MKLTKDAKIKGIYTTLIILIIANTWKLIYTAQFLEYDDNWGNITVAFVISLWTTLILTILWFKFRYIIKMCKWQTLLFLMLASPVTLVLVVKYYHELFGTGIKN
jgi:hypothetical protein